MEAYLEIRNRDERRPKLSSDEYSRMFRHFRWYKPAWRSATTIYIEEVPQQPKKLLPCSMVLGDPLTFTAVVTGIVAVPLDNNKSPVQNRPLAVNGPVYTSKNGLRRLIHMTTQVTIIITVLFVKSQ